MPMSLQLIALVVLLVAALSIAATAVQSNRRRIRILSRTGTMPAGETKVPLITVADPSNSFAMRVGDWAEKSLPEALIQEEGQKTLIQAGYDSPAAPAIYALIRLVCALGIPAVMFAWGPRDTYTMLLFSGGVGIALGIVGPPAMLARQQRLRQERLRRSLPDALDLLLVCVEAGVSLDAAILRVGREIALVHPELADEFLVMNRRMNAGMRREEALHGMFQRTGVEELRALASNMIQSERWGTSIGKVLRVYSETLRRKRKQAAEKKAAVAATKMIFPLELFILPALFAVIGGPAVLGLKPVLEALGGR